ncbi:hypothetical protein A8B74_16830 [Sulfitobacter geojensis]|nr:hypothetical protein A8B74_16830 [Sulfitobacter geojensis]
MRGGGWSGGALLVFGSERGLFAGIKEIGRFANAGRRKVIALQLFLSDPHAVAKVTRRGEIHQAA